MKHTFKLDIVYDKPNPNSGITYSKEQLEYLLSAYFNSKNNFARVIDCSYETLSIDLSTVCGSVTDIRFVEDNTIDVDIQIFENTPYGIIISSLIKENINMILRVVMTGIVNKEDKTASDITLHKISIDTGLHK